MKNNWFRRVLALVMALLLAVPAFAFAEALQPTGLVGKNTTVPAYGTIDLNVNNSIYIVLNGRVIKSAHSSRRKVADIDITGRITALKEGKAKITVKYTDRTRSIFYVQVKDPNKPDSVSFAQGASINLYVGQSRTLTPKLSPDTATTTYTWKSNRRKVATVNNGVVTAVKPGTAKITVTTRNRKKCTIVVNVLANKVDNINPMPSAATIAAYRGKWTVVLKSVEILSGGKVALEFYVINGINTSSRIENLYVDLFLNGSRLMSGTVKKINFRSKGGTCKVLKVTYPNSLANYACLPTLALRTFSFNGLNGQLRHRK